MVSISIKAFKDRILAAKQSMPEAREIEERVSSFPSMVTTRVYPEDMTMKRRIKLEASPMGVAILTTVARASKAFTDFPDRIDFRLIQCAEKRDFDRRYIEPGEISVAKSKSGKWRFAGQYETLAKAGIYSHDKLSQRRVINQIGNALGLKSHREFESLVERIRWEPNTDMRTQIENVSDLLHLHVMTGFAYGGVNLYDFFQSNLPMKQSEMRAIVQDRGVDVEAPADPFTRSPTEYIIRVQDIKTMEALLEEGLLKPDFAALSMSLGSNSRMGTKAFDLLIERGGNVLEKTEEGTLLHAVARKAANLIRTSSFHRRETIQHFKKVYVPRLIEMGVDPSEVDANGRTAAMIVEEAVKKNNDGSSFKRAEDVELVEALNQAPLLAYTR